MNPENVVGDCGMPVWTNWAGNVAAEPKRLATPATLDELRREVAAATARGWQVRVAGTGHSFSAICATDGLLLDLSGLTGIERVDPATGDATILAGTKIYDLGEPLFLTGRALSNQGDIDRQAVAGAVGTGTHGTGRRFGSFSNAVRAVELVTPAGDLVTISAASEAEMLSAAALNLGMLGVVSRVTLATVPAYKLRESTRPLGFDECLEVYPEIEASHRNAEFWWVPPLDTCVVKSFLETDDEPMSQPETEHPVGTLARYLKPDKVDWSYKVYPSTRSLRFVEMEFTLPITNGPAAIRAVRHLIQMRHPAIRWGVEYRTLAGEGHLLSPTQGADSVTISVHQAAELPYETFMRDCQEIFLALGGRPHWGKLHWLERADIDRLYPTADRFRAIRERLDPNGHFLNDHLRPLFG